MLRQPIKKDQLSILSKDVIQSIAPYLMEQKTAKVFGNWIQEYIRLTRNVTKQQIIETVHKLEQNSALKLCITKYIPAHFAQTQLGLKEVSQLILAPVYSAQPVDLPRPSPRRGSGNRTSGWLAHDPGHQAKAHQGLLGRPKRITSRQVHHRARVHIRT